MWPMPTAIGNNVSGTKGSKSASGGFTYCVPVYFRNSNKNLELPFNSFPYRQRNAKRLLGKKWLYSISRKNFKDFDIMYVQIVCQW